MHVYYVNMWQSVYTYRYYSAACVFPLLTVPILKAVLCLSLSNSTYCELVIDTSKYIVMLTHERFAGIVCMLVPLEHKNL